MRKIIVLAAAVLGGVLATPASAQPLGGLMGILNGARSIGYSASSSCSGGGIGQVLCQTQRLNSVASDLRDQRDQIAQRQEQEQQRQQRIGQALVRACRMGDQYSCERAGPAIDPRQQQLQQALADACRAGDGISCGRADDMRRDMIEAQSAYRR